MEKFYHFFYVLSRISLSLIIVLQFPFPNGLRPNLFRIFTLRIQTPWSLESRDAVVYGVVSSNEHVYLINK